jgi:hypothetical protein
VRTLLSRNITLYRGLYTDITGDHEFVGYAKNEAPDKNVEKVKTSELSITQKTALLQGGGIYFLKSANHSEIRKKP